MTKAGSTMWNREEGSILAEPINIEDKIEKYLSKENYDLNAAGNTARRYLEYILKQICRTNKLKIPYVTQPDLNSFFSLAMADTKKAVRNTPLEEYYKEVWDDLNKLRFMANVLSHDNINFNEVSYSEVKSFCEAVINLRKAVTCNEDGNFLIFDKYHQRLNCSRLRCTVSLNMNDF